MLKDSLFEIIQITDLNEALSEPSEYSKYEVLIRLNPSHSLFKGHFPDNPVVPGVCQLRIFTEVLSHIEKRLLVMKEADQIKFLAMINPNEYPELSLIMKFLKTDNEGIKLTAELLSGEKKFLKFKARYC